MLDRDSDVDLKVETERKSLKPKILIEVWTVTDTALLPVTVLKSDNLGVPIKASDQ